MSHLILLVSDDGPTDQEIRQSLLRTAPDFQVELVSSRDEIEIQRVPTVILLDLMLSREPACELLRWMRNEPRFSNIPVFVLGSEVLNRDVNEAYALGANACLLKRSLAEGFSSIAQGIAAYASLRPRAVA